MFFYLYLGYSLSTVLLLYFLPFIVSGIIACPTPTLNIELEQHLLILYLSNHFSTSNGKYVLRYISLLGEGTRPTGGRLHDPG